MGVVVIPGGYMNAPLLEADSRKDIICYCRGWDHRAVLRFGRLRLWYLVLSSAKESLKEGHSSS